MNGIAILSFGKVKWTNGNANLKLAKLSKSTALDKSSTTGFDGN